MAASKRITKTYTLSADTIKRIERLCSLLGIRYDTQLIDTLVREEWERRAGPLRFSIPPPAPNSVETAADHAAKLLARSHEPDDEPPSPAPRAAGRTATDRKKKR